MACEELKSDLVSIPSIGEEFKKAQIDFPATRNLFSPAEVIDHIINNIISEKAKKAFLPDATEKDFQSYKHWLNRAFKGTRWKHSSSTFSTGLSYSDKEPWGANNIDLHGHLFSFYKCINSETE